jgi:formate hydrogenlyase subunit 3/multisubunit Na+/H+ antiporter MnhD subunit
MLVLIPLFGAVLCFVLPRLSRLVGIAAFAGSATCLWLLSSMLRTSGPLHHIVGGWQAPLGIQLYLDGASWLGLSVTWIIGAAVSIYASAYFTSREQRRAFMPLWMMLWAGLNALFLSRDLFNLYVTLELIGLAAVALVALPGKRDALVAAMRYLLVSLLGSLLYLLGVALMYAVYGQVDIHELASVVSDNPTTRVALAVMLVGLLLKAALFPLHFWLPPAHANAPAPVSALLSALVVKGSLFILFRLWTQVYAGVLPPLAGPVIGLLGSGAIIWGSLQALVQPRLKMLIAYSTVAQLGYLFLFFALAADEPISLAAWTGCLYFLAAHACAKTAMFFAAGNMLHAAGNDEIVQLGKLSHVVPRSFAAFALAGISIIGLPPSGGFLGKWLLLNAALQKGQWWWVLVIACGGLLAAAYVVRICAVGFSKEAPPAELHPVPPAMEWMALGMAALAITLGVWSALPIELIGIGASVEPGPLLQGGPLP